MIRNIHWLEIVSAVMYSRWSVFCFFCFFFVFFFVVDLFSFLFVFGCCLLFLFLLSFVCFVWWFFFWVFFYVFFGGRGGSHCLWIVLITPSVFSEVYLLPTVCPVYCVYTVAIVFSIVHSWLLPLAFSNGYCTICQFH